MKTRREFFKLFGKAALVGGVVAVVPAAAVALAPKPDIDELAAEILNYPLAELQKEMKESLNNPQIVTSGNVYTYVGKNGEFLGDVSEEAWTIHSEWTSAKDFYEGIR